MNTRAAHAWLVLLLEHLEGQPELHPDQANYWRPLIDGTRKAIVDLTEDRLLTSPETLLQERRYRPK